MGCIVITNLTFLGGYYVVYLACGVFAHYFPCFCIATSIYLEWALFVLDVKSI